MEKFPIVRIKRGKTKFGNKIYKKKEAISIMEELAKKYGMVYTLDLDGFRKNSANLNLYKKLRKLWVDAHPRYVEDVMDLIIVGIERITIRNLNFDYLKEIREICEQEIFLVGKDAVKKVKEFGFDGVVLDEEEDIKEDIQTWKIYLNEEVIKRIR